VLLEACREQSQPNQPAVAGLSGTAWQLTQIDTGNGSLPLSQADTILLRFDDERRISGESAGLWGNTWFGVYSVFESDSLRLDSLVSTEMACPNSQYWDCYSYLMRAESFQQSGTQLEIYCNGGMRKLNFTLIR
jgi:heat shock protein HslJ